MGDYEKHRYPGEDSPPTIESLGHSGSDVDGAPTHYHGMGYGIFAPDDAEIRLKHV